MYRYKFFEVKNRDNLVEVESLLFTTNSVVDNLFNQSSC